MVRLLEKSLLLRKSLARLATWMRGAPTVRRALGWLGFSGKDVWASNKSAGTYRELYQTYEVDFSSLIVGDRKKVGLIALASDPVVFYFTKACNELEVVFEIFDPASESFIHQIACSPIQIFMARPSHSTQQTRQMFMEKIDVVVQDLGKTVYPSPRELRIYEAKRSLAYFLQATGTPHPKTWIFQDRDAALAFLATAEFPLVFKTQNGAASSGVEILKSRRHATRITKTCFQSYYMNKSISDYRDIDYGYVIFQEYIPDVREFRVIKIGDSWMGHEKTRNGTGEFMSGSGVNLWTRPSDKVLDFCRSIADKFGFTTMCFDIFEDTTGNLLVNELQTWFGSYNPSQMYIEGVPGRLVFEGGAYGFEPGLFNHNQSISLRLVDLLNRR